uniref:cysteine dioxygenase n=2 Tax=Sar TaxID=2698737 RepID=A0A7S3PMW2_9STRA
MDTFLSYLDVYASADACTRNDDKNTNKKYRGARFGKASLAMVLDSLKSAVTLDYIKRTRPYAINDSRTSLLVQKPEYSVLLVSWKPGESVVHKHPGNVIIKVLQGQLYTSQFIPDANAESKDKDRVLLSAGDVCQLGLGLGVGLESKGWYSLENAVREKEKTSGTDDVHMDIPAAANSTSTTTTVSLHIRLHPGPGILAPCCCDRRPWVLCNDVADSITEKQRMACIAAHIKTATTEEKGSTSISTEAVLHEDEKQIELESAAPKTDKFLQNSPGLCYTNFGNLIKMLHRRVEPLEPGKFHSEAHIEEICKLLSSVRLNRKEYGRYLRFRDDHYTRNLVGYDVPEGEGDRPKFTVLLLCWEKGQMSPIHDHAGSSCWVKVLVGQLREIRYETIDDETSTPDHTNLKIVRDMKAGVEEVCYINDTQGLHAMGNANSDQVCVSLHVYAPPYVLCKIFDEKSGAISVGSMAAATTPCNPFASLSFSNQDCVPVGESYQGMLGITGFMNCLRELSDKANSEMQDNPGLSDAPGELLSRLYLKTREWKEFVHFDSYRYQRSLVAFNSQFSLILISWNKGQTTPIHDHGNKDGGCWVKVLSGNLVLRKYGGDKHSPILESEYKFKEGEMVQGEGENKDLFDGLHLLGNLDDVPAVSLHLYTPPMLDLKYQDGCGNDMEIPLVHSATSLLEHYNHINSQHLRTYATNRHVTFSDDNCSVEEKSHPSTEESNNGEHDSQELLLENILAGTVHYSSLPDFCRYIRKYVFSRSGEMTSTERFRLVSQMFSKFEFQEEEWMPYYRDAKSRNKSSFLRECSWSGSASRIRSSRDNMSVSSFGSSASSNCDNDSLFVSALLAKGNNFTLRLVCWESGFVQTPQLQQNCTCSWIKVLSGLVDETQYHTNPFASGNRQEVVHNVSLGAHGAVTYLGPTLVFSLENCYDKPCFALSLEFLA